MVSPLYFLQQNGWDGTDIAYPPHMFHAQATWWSLEDSTTRNLISLILSVKNLLRRSRATVQVQPRHLSINNTYCTTCDLLVRANVTNRNYGVFSTGNPPYSVLEGKISCSWPDATIENRFLELASSQQWLPAISLMVSCQSRVQDTGPKFLTKMRGDKINLKKMKEKEYFKNK